MENQGTEYATDVERLRELELHNRFEPITRLIAVSGAGILIYIYTGWIICLIWAVHFVLALGAHAIFVSTRGSSVSRREVMVAGLLFGNLQIAFSWLPSILFGGESRPLMLVGGALICAQLLFLVRRSDTLHIYTVVQVSVVAAMSIAAYVAFLPDLDTPLAFIGTALALFGLNFYFWQSLRVGRWLRISREKAGRQMHQAQKMAAIGQLAGGVAHDFNNNLTAIIGSLELIQLTDDPREQKLDVDNALVAARQAATTVKHLMIFARMEKPNNSLIKIDDVFAELGTLTRRLIPVSIAFEVSVTEPDLTVRADRHQLLSGLINLVVNSVDAMPQGGLLTIQSESTIIEKPKALADGSQLPAGTYLLIKVTDTGNGIPADILPSVLDPFFTTKGPGKGTGLGLSMVAGMLKEPGGGLAIESDKNGTQMRLYLPLVSPRGGGQ